MPRRRPAPANPNSATSQSRKPKVDDNTAQLFGLPVPSIFDDATTPKATSDMHVERLNMQLRADLATRPIYLMDDIRVVHLKFSRGYPNSSGGVDMLTVGVSRPVSCDLLPIVGGTVEFKAKVIERVHEKIRPEFVMSRYHNFYAILLQSEHSNTMPHPPGDYVEEYEGNQIKILVLTLECIEGHQQQWEKLLTDFNKCIAKVLKTRHIVDAAGQRASVKLSNQYNQILITITFPESFEPQGDWYKAINEQLMWVFVDARMAHIKQDPKNPNNVRAFAAIEQYCMSHIDLLSQ